MSKYNEIFGQMASFDTMPEGGDGSYIEVTVHALKDSKICAGAVVIVDADEYRALKSEVGDE